MVQVKRLFFENPLPLIVLLAAAWAIALFVWYRRRSRRTAFAAVILPAAACLLVLMAWAVDTDREEISAAYEAFAEQFPAGQIEALETYLDDPVEARLEGRTEYRSLEKKDAIELAVELSEQAKITAITYRDMEITVTGETATARFVVMVWSEDVHTSGRPVAVECEMLWTKRPAGWRLTRVVRMEQVRQL